MKKLFSVLIFFSGTQLSFSQKIYFAKANYQDSSLLQNNINILAKQTLTLYKDNDQGTYFDNALRLQILAGNYKEVNKTLKKLSFFALNDSITPTALGFPYVTYNDVLATGASGSDFSSRYKTIFQRKYEAYNDDNKLWVTEYFDNSLNEIQKKLQNSLQEYNISDSLSINDAIKLCRNYLAYNTYSATQPLAKAILAKIENEKFIVQDSVVLKMPDGGSIALTVVRSRKNSIPLPVVLKYNIYAGRDITSCKDAVNRGYVGIVANTRGKRLSNDAIEPFEHDAKDAYYIIDWISKQPWCNGKVGMYGGSYLGFSQWSAVKYLHPALKTIVPQVSVGVGIDYPAHNNVFMNYALQWIHFVTDTRLTDYAGSGNEQKWNKVNEDWYKSGASFRSLDSIEGRPNTIFQRWLKHPGYDMYWQNMTPQKQEFAKINIPIFTTTGYWDSDQTGAMYYYHQYFKWNKNPNYYLLIGPYDHSGSQAYPKPLLHGYNIDSVANIPILDIVFKWFDYILKDSSKPAILKDKVTFEVMGKNEWKSVPSLSAMANDTLSLYPQPGLVNGHYTLSFTRPAKQSFLAQTVNLKDRSEMLFSGQETALGSYPLLIDSAIRSEKDKLIFVSNPVDKPVIISGALQAAIVASINKKDMDIVIDLFEQTPDGKYIALTQNIQRASYAEDRAKRQLLTAGKIETINIKDTYITCRQLQKGSRIVVVMGINKSPYWQINYGTGKDVSDETMADAATPLQIKWYNTSCIKIPVLKD